MTCVGCQKPIAEPEPYWWAKLGGEWHAACYAKVVFGGGWAVGGWRGPHDGPGDPPEFEAELNRLRILAPAPTGQQ